MTQENPIAWFEIYVADLERARGFYETVFEVKLQDLPSPVPEMKMAAFPSDRNAYGCGGALVQMEGVVPGSGCGTLVYFHCRDCAVEEGRVVSAGGRIHRPKMSIGPFGFISLVNDPEGNLIGLHST